VLRIPCDGVAALHLNIGLGDIEFYGEERADIELRLSRGEQDDLEILRAGDTVHIRQRPDMRSGWFGLGHDRHIDVQAAVPTTLTRLEMHSGLGSVCGRQVQAQVRLATGKGDIRFEGSLEGRASTGLGSIVLAGVRGETVVNTGCGDLTIRRAEGGRLEASTGAGQLRIEGGRLDALRASSGAGDIHCACALGVGDFRLENGAGNIQLELPANQAAQIEASSSMGNVTSDFPLVRVGRPGPVALGSVRMVGSIGDEGLRARLVAKTGLGNITLRRGPAVEEAPAARPAPVGAEQDPAPTSDAPAPNPQPAPPPPPAPVGAGLDSTPAEDATIPESPADARLAILESLARGEISVDEAEQLILHLSKAQGESA